MLGCLLFLQDIQSDIFLGCKSGILSEKCLAWQVHFFLRKALQKLRGVCYSYELWRRELTLYSYLESCLLKIGNLLILISNILFYMWEESASQTSKFLQIVGDNSKVGRYLTEEWCTLFLWKQASSEKEKCISEV